MCRRNYTAYNEMQCITNVKCMPWNSKYLLNPVLNIKTQKEELKNPIVHYQHEYY